MLRAIVLSLALLIGIGTLIPLATEFAEAGPRKKRKYQKKKVKKYSKRWWKSRNRQKRAKQARLKRKKQARVRRARAVKVRRARTAKLRRTKTARTGKVYSRSRSREKRISRKAPVSTTDLTTRANSAAADFMSSQSSAKGAVTKQPLMAVPAPAVLPSGQAAPKSWKAEGVVQGELMFRVSDPAGSPVGSASISVIGPASADAPVYNNRVKTVGGVTTTALRRTVIDQMIRENGWVVNDYQKDIGGQSVYVVVAQAPGAGNQVENRMYYFTEVEGKIYSVATKSPDKGSERLEEESEKVLNSLQRRTAPPTQVATNRTVSNLVANEE